MLNVYQLKMISEYWEKFPALLMNYAWKFRPPPLLPLPHHRQ